MSVCPACGEETYGAYSMHLCRIPTDAIRIRPGYSMSPREGGSWLDRHYRGLMLLGMALELLLLAALVAIEVWK